MQESLTNSRKHGGPATTATVVLTYADDELRLQITDDGRGGAAISDGGGHGLVGMRERVEMYGGALHAGPLQGRGYRVAATLPIGAAEEAPAVARQEAPEKAPAMAPAEKGVA